MKILTIAAAALLAASALPAKADGNIGLIAVSACQSVKAGIPIGRAVALAANSTNLWYQQARTAGYTPEEIARQTVVQMHQWACPEEFNSSTHTTAPAPAHSVAVLPTTALPAAPDAPLAPANLRAPR